YYVFRSQGRFEPVMRVDAFPDDMAPEQVGKVLGVQAQVQQRLRELQAENPQRLLELSQDAYQQAFKEIYEKTYPGETALAKLQGLYECRWVEVNGKPAYEMFELDSEGNVRRSLLDEETGAYLNEDQLDGKYPSGNLRGEWMARIE